MYIVQLFVYDIVFSRLVAILYTKNQNMVYVSLKTLCCSAKFMLWLVLFFPVHLHFFLFAFLSFSVR